MAELSTNPPPVRTRELAKTFQQGRTSIRALNGVSVEARKGELLAVMGASGSGKSTLLHLVAGLAAPTAGSVEIDGEPLAGKSDRALAELRRRRVGLVFQAFNLIPTLTAEENVLLPLRLDGNNDRARAAHVLELVGLADRRHHRPDALSGGEQQRVAIARALVVDPTVLLADEPTGNLDSRSTANICRILRETNEKQQCAMILVTHEPQVAVWAQRVVVLRDGAVVADFPTDRFGDAHELAAHYQELLAGPTDEATPKPR